MHRSSQKLGPVVCYSASDFALQGCMLWVCCFLQPLHSTFRWLLGQRLRVSHLGVIKAIALQGGKFPAGTIIIITGWQPIA